MNKKIKNIALALVLTLIPTALIWLPFFLRLKTFWTIPLSSQGMATIVANFDGPLYIIVAKTFYIAETIKANFQFPLPTEYYAAHLPLFPILIRIFSYILGYPYAMLFVTLASSFLAIYFFNKLVRRYVRGTDAIWLTVFFSFLPARWLIVRSVGSPEPLFIAATIATILYFKKKKYLFAGIWGMIAAMTKSPGVLIFLALIFSLILPHYKKIATNGIGILIEKLNLKKTFPLLLIPLGLFLVFIIYSLTFGDFFAYFKSGDNIHLFFPPFQVFNYSAPWVGTFWLEEIIFIYLIGILGAFKLYKEKADSVFYYYLIMLSSIFFVAHRDVLRYALPLIPFVIIAFRDSLLTKEFKIAFSIILIPIFLYSLAFISQNAMPISNWAPFL